MYFLFILHFDCMVKRFMLKCTNLSELALKFSIKSSDSKISIVHTLLTKQIKVNYVKVHNTILIKILSREEKAGRPYYIWWLLKASQVACSSILSKYIHSSSASRLLHGYGKVVTCMNEGAAGELNRTLMNRSSAAAPSAMRAGRLAAVLRAVRAYRCADATARRAYDAAVVAPACRL